MLAEIYMFCVKLNKQNTLIAKYDAVVTIYDFIASHWHRLVDGYYSVYVGGASDKWEAVPHNQFVLCLKSEHVWCSSPKQFHFNIQLLPVYFDQNILK